MSPTTPAATAPLVALDTKITGEFTQPFKDRAGKNVTALLGATIQADIPAPRVGQAIRPLGVVLNDKEIARVPIDFAHLD